MDAERSTPTCRPNQRKQLSQLKTGLRRRTPMRRLISVWAVASCPRWWLFNKTWTYTPIGKRVGMKCACRFQTLRRANAKQRSPKQTIVSESIVHQRKKAKNGWPESEVDPGFGENSSTNTRCG